MAINRKALSITEEDFAHKWAHKTNWPAYFLSYDSPPLGFAVRSVQATKSNESNNISEVNIERNYCIIVS